MQRDWGAGAHARVGTASAAPVGGFVPRDPTGTKQYADGMNLYQYVQSNPVIRGDPTGLWGAVIHRDKTTEWAKGKGIGMVPWAGWQEWVCSGPQIGPYRYYMLTVFEINGAGVGNPVMGVNEIELCTGG